MKAMIFAAGLGTRLKPITDRMPKALVPVGGIPLLKRVIGRLNRFGFEDFVVNVHHFSAMMKDYIAQTGFGSCRVTVSDETGLLRDTGGGVLHARELLEGTEPFLVHNADIVSDIDLGKFFRSHRPEAVATLLVSVRKTQRYLLFRRESGHLRLVGWTNLSTGEVRSPFPGLRRSASPDFDTDAFLKKEGLERYAFAGIHVMSPEIFRYMEGRGECFPIMDFYLSVADQVEIDGYVAADARIVDVGKADTLAEAEEMVRRIDAETGVCVF